MLGFRHDMLKEVMLPEQRLRDKGKPTLVLDLDGTLIGTSRQLDGPHSKKFDFVVDYDDRELPVGVRKRPGLHGFLKEMSEVYEIVVFSLGSRPYVEKVMDQLDPDGTLVAYRLARDSCCVPGVKDLNNQFGRELTRVVWIDDFRDSFKNNPENGLVVPFFAAFASSDHVLPGLAKLLKALATEQDMRAGLSSLPLPLLRDSNFARSVSRCVSALRPMTC